MTLLSVIPFAMLFTVYSMSKFFAFNISYNLFAYDRPLLILLNIAFIVKLPYWRFYLWGKPGYDHEGSRVLGAGGFVGSDL